MLKRRYAISEVAIEVHCDSRDLLSAVDPLLAAHRICGDVPGPAALSDGPHDPTQSGWNRSSRRFLIDVELRGTKVPRVSRRYPNAQPLFVYDVARGFRTAGELLVTDGFSELWVREDRIIQGTVDPATLERSYLFAVVTFNLALQVCLRAAGLYYVHAAVVRSSRGTIAVAGDSRAGKTTLALALVEGGCRFVSDDAVFLRKDARTPGPREVEIHAFRRPIHLSSATAAMFPALAASAEGPMPGRMRQVWDLDPTEAFPGRVIDRTGPPDMLVIAQGGRDEALSTLTPIDRATALEGLLRQSAFVALGGPATQQHLDLLAKSVPHGANYAFTRGQDAEGRPGATAALILDALGSLLGNRRTQRTA